MKEIIIYIVIVFNSSLLFAQKDTVMLLHGRTLTGFIQEISSEEIIIKNKRDVLYRVHLSEVTDLTYKNGSKDAYVESRTRKVVKDNPSTDNFGKNIIGMNTLEFLNQNIDVHYERFFKDGLLSIMPFLTYSLNRFSIHQYSHFFARDYGVGLNMRIYPLGQARLTYFLGIGSECGMFKYYSDATRWRMPEPINYDDVEYIHNYLQNGVRYQFTYNFNISIAFNLGFRSNFTLNNRFYQTERFVLNFEYRF